MALDPKQLALPVESAKARMEELSAKLCDLIASQPPRELLGYLWSQTLLAAMARANDANKGREAPFSKESIQCALEYVHATWATTSKAPAEGQVNEPACVEIISTAADLLTATMLYSMASSQNGEAGVFGPMTGEIEFTAKYTWTLIRGNRYQVLEREFFAFVLAPHNEALKIAYGVGAEEIAVGFQEIANSMRTGQMHATEVIGAEMAKVRAYAKKNDLEFEQAAVAWRKEDTENIRSSVEAFQDLFHGGICNLTRQTHLPPQVLDDLSYEIGENTEFCAEGDFCKTPLRTLPARIKPLIKIGDNHYATDVAFVRDSGYRALQRGLLNRLPDYREQWNANQKILSENAFSQIFKSQLEGAQEFNEVYYRDVDTGNWVENDTLILLDDVLLQIEAKAGIAAMHSPATNFGAHIRAIQDLVIKAYNQCRRFIKYISSMEEAPIYQRIDGNYVEILKIRSSRYRTMLPIGLTVESFSPFSAMCKEIPAVSPILGRHPFVSMSIDDLFVLKRFLPTPGELVHYLRVRQVVSGIKGAKIFDELDHLGAYVTRNRFDMDLEEQVRKGMVTWDGFCEPIDAYFAGDCWEKSPPPRQKMPHELSDLLDSLNRNRPDHWLFLDNALRDLSAQSRNVLSDTLQKLRNSLAEFESRSFTFGGSPTFFFWLHRNSTTADRNAVRRKAQAACLASKQEKVLELTISVAPNGKFQALDANWIEAPSADAEDLADLQAQARSLKFLPTPNARQSASHAKANHRKIGRNDPCWCGSGRKYKKCHGG